MGNYNVLNIIIYKHTQNVYLQVPFTIAHDIPHKTGESRMGQNILTQMNIQVRGIHWEKRRIKHTQMKRKQCILLFRALLCYFYITFTFFCA